MPVNRPIAGSTRIAPKIVIMKMPPVLWTHLPTDRPMVDVTTINDRISADDTPRTSCCWSSTPRAVQSRRRDRWRTAGRSQR